MANKDVDALCASVERTERLFRENWSAWTDDERAEARAMLLAAADSLRVAIARARTGAAERPVMLPLAEFLEQYGPGRKTH